ncbi:hypothetical protein KDH_11850 [Dictyobacter sp. S3.2.2.5]|uniref:AAA+ ATPase domain-containing protein n=1 Tax=Dictyobacter halimunensis TaxID=3026934 RepID=A0ABQ6FPI3_9CHLR|nr:hypothetical protein KDH_11850 [Dictyobacter sp. S3.2.2.5]
MLLLPQNGWYVGKNNRGYFNTTLQKFAKHYVGSNPEASEQFRALLQDLNARTLGHKIEQCYTFLQQEKNRLQDTGLSVHSIISPISSAFIMSQFAHWLDPQGELLISTQYVRESTVKLVRGGLLPNHTELKPSGSDFIIRTGAQYSAFLSLFDAVREAAPQITSLLPPAYWREYFIWWSMNHRKELITSDTVLMKENDNAELLSSTPTQHLHMEEQDSLSSEYREKADDELASHRSLFIEHEPLLPIPEPWLSENIREVQRHILVDEQVIRRIYHALLSGHVILTGPPGTGKTDLARIIPEVLWRSPMAADSEHMDEAEGPEANGAPGDANNITETAYTTRLVTATDDWSTRTLISGIVPHQKDGQVSYRIQYGHLTTAIMKNWSFQGERTEDWSMLSLQRTRVTTTNSLARGITQTFKGQWLVIDEFNRAPIDRALGDALTALGGHNVLRVGIESGSAELPIPLDFRIIGSLNSFDRNYLNQISEALKRRFAFIEILPPTRAYRREEQSIVLYKALRDLKHLNQDITIEENAVTWAGVVTIQSDAEGIYQCDWDQEHPLFTLFYQVAWPIFEVLRIYRQLGTAQAITLIRQWLTPGILRAFTTADQWMGALDTAFCDIIADQLQVLLPDELDVLIWYLKFDAETFSQRYQQVLDKLVLKPRRLGAHLDALSMLVDERGQPFLCDEDIEHYTDPDEDEELEEIVIEQDILDQVFHLDHPAYHLPHFVRRLRTYKAEHGL